MIVKVSELCPSCRQLPGVAGLTVEATINTINSKKENGISPPFSDDQTNAMIYSCIYKYNDVSHSCLRLIMDMIPPSMRGRY